MKSEVTQSCPTLRDPIDCSLPGSSIHGISQARVPEWGAIAFSAVNPKGNQPWIFFGRPGAEWSSSTLATWCEELTHWKRPWCWERLKGGEGGDREWDGWMASLTLWTWVWASSGSWWWTGKPGMLQSTRLQRVGHDWSTELNWTDVFPTKIKSVFRLC